MSGILRFVSILFLIFEKGDEQKNCARYFEIRKYALFLIFGKGMSKNAVPGILRFVRMLFLIFEKRMSKKTVPGILRFVSMLFLIFEKGDEQKNCARYFEIPK